MAGGGPSYAPDDPTLPKPWKGLVDGNTGNLYFWNPETNVTQYQRPVAQISSSPDLKESEYVVSQQPSIISPQGQQKNDTFEGYNQFRSHVSVEEKVQQSSIPYSESEGEVLKEHRTGNGDNECKNRVIIEEKVQQSSIPYRHVSVGEKVQQSSIPSGEGLKEHFTDNDDNQRGNHVNIEEKAGILLEGHNPNAYNIQSKGLKEEKEKCSEGKVMAASLVGKPACDNSRSLNGGSVPQPSKQSADLYCKKHEIRVSGGSVPMPFMTFETTNFPREILRAVRDAGFSAPTPIQAQTWPIALQRRDIIAVAKTGSGKTLGYLIPGFYHVKNLKRNNKMGPTVLILSPTRELATQILDEAEKFGSSSAISCTCLYGGSPKGPQLAALARGVDIVVATPGRLNDILEMKRISLQQVSYLVLDEADRMLDMGFEPQIRKVVKEIPEGRQTLMYTATWPKEVRKIAADLLANPVQVNIGNVDELVANKSITQHVKVVDSTEKKQQLKQLLRSLQPGKTIIFCSTKRMCDILAENLDEHFGAAAIHGDKSQEVRDNVLSDFRTGKSLILVATDVAARGLDVKDVRVVINYDFPTGIEDYVHRIGRTGRAGATGVAYTFFTDMDAKYASGLIKILEGAGQNVPPELRSMPSYGGGYSCGGRTGRQWGSGGGGRGSKWGGSDGGNQSNLGSWSSQSCSGGWSEKSDKGGFGNNGMRARSRSPVKRAWG